MMKKFLCLLLSVIFALTLFAACGDDPASTDTGADTGAADTTASSDAGSGDKTDAGADSADAVLFDPDAEHKILVSDIRHHSLVLMDLNLCNTWSDLTNDNCVVWEWIPEESEGCVLGKSHVGVGIDDGKFRYSPYYKRDVVIATSSAGWAGVIDYETKAVLWEVTLFDCPHSIEMMPNGDIIVAGSGGNNINDGELVYYPLSTGATQLSGRLPIPACHGVCWDPDEELLWVLGMYGIDAVTIDGYGTNKAKPVALNGMGAEFKNDSAGHDLSPVFGSKTKYWATAGAYVWQFDTETGELTRSYPRVSSVSKKNVKGIAYFPDNTMVQTVAAGNTKETAYEWSTLFLRVMTMEKSSGKVQEPKYASENIKFSDREFYKVHTFTKDYK